ncbi:hypothetical protein K440DRAFT_646239 [Wilcoxina mikolae CBS 423.85]|nr:hypothetical protein K440DRAFT_646239 [Wilcoxina mikolae CBS 423.85]
MILLFLYTAATVLLLQLVHALPVKNITQEFYLRTEVIEGPKGFNNLYPWSYHTGAGTSVPTLRPYKQGSVKSYFNGTRLNADFGTDFPWGWMPGYWSPYASWNSVDINAGIGSEGFKISKKTLVYEDSVWVDRSGSRNFRARARRLSLFRSTFERRTRIEWKAIASTYIDSHDEIRVSVSIYESGVNSHILYPHHFSSLAISMNEDNMPLSK